METPGIRMKAFFQERKLMKNKVLIVGHIRSGHHFLADSIGLNSSYNGFVWLNINSNSLKKTRPGIVYKNHGHASWHENYMNNLLNNYHIFVPVRDGRDVMVSSFYFLKVHTRNTIRKDMTFQEFLRERAYVENWVNHVKGWINQPVYFVRYEDLYFNFKRTINLVLEAIEEPVKKNPKHPKFGTYYSMNNIQRKGIVGDWKNHFTGEDLKYFDKIAGETMKSLGYYKGRCW